MPAFLFVIPAQAGIQGLNAQPLFIAYQEINHAKLDYFSLLTLSSTGGSIFSAVFLLKLRPGHIDILQNKLTCQSYIWP